jgi:putative (di)nucleoside polyphosphate hydrolase
MFRTGVSVLITNNNAEFLLVNLISFEEEFFAIPGGGLEGGESYIDAAYRETKEEVGISRDMLKYIGESEIPLKIVFKTPKKTKAGEEYIGSEKYFFAFKFVGNDSQIKLQEAEVRSYKWVPHGDLGKYLLFDNQLQETQGKIVEIFQ